MAREVEVSTWVSVDLPLCFRKFTEEVDQWWRRGPRFRSRSDSTVRLDAQGLSEEHEGTQKLLASVRSWEPPRLIELDMEGEPVRIRFAPERGGTRVTVTHGRSGARTAFQDPIGVWWAELLAALSR